MEKEPETKTESDVRVQATGTIWGLAVGMMAISIPLSSVTETAFIPLFVIAGAAVGTVAVWRPGTKKEGTSTKEQIAAQQRIAELEERLANLETINNFERHLAEKTLERQLAVPTGEVMKDVQSETTTEAPSEAQRVAA
jgi:hypothetical protein